MQVGWVQDMSASIAAVCAFVALTECVCGEKERQGGLWLVCGAYTALTIVRAASDCIRMLV